MVEAIKTNINIRVLYRSKFGNFDTNSNTVLDKYDSFIKGFFLTNIALNKDFANGLNLQTGINNLFNYTDKTNIANMPGIQYFTRIQYQF